MGFGGTDSHMAHHSYGYVQNMVNIVLLRSGLIDRDVVRFATITSCEQESTGGHNHFIFVE